MKNSPDPEWFNKVEKRLGGYSEEPDALVWERISSAIRKQYEPGWVPWAHRGSVVVILLVSLWAGKHFVLGPEIPVHKEKISEKSLEKSSQESTFGEVAAPSGKKLQGDVENKTPAMTDYARKRESKISGYTRAIQVEGISPEEKSRTIEIPVTSGVKLSAMNGDEVVIFDSTHVDTPTGEAVPAANRKPIIPQRKKSRWVFYSSISPSLSFQKLLPLTGDGVVIEGFIASPVFSSNRSGLGFQAGIQSTVGRRFELYGGFSFYRQSQALVYRYVSEDVVNANQTEEFEYALGPGTLEKSVKYAMINAGAEAGLIYHLRGDRLAHKVGGGISWQHGFRQARSGESYNNSQSQYVFYQIFYRNEYALSNSMRIYVQPFFKRSILARETLNEPFQIKPYHAGLSIGFVFGHR